MAANLSKGYTLRSTTWDDLDDVQKMIYEACKNFGDAEMAASSEELAVGWRTEGFNLDTDSWVVLSPENLIVGYEEFNNRFEHCLFNGDGYVHPKHYNQGIGSTLLEQLVQRALLDVPLAPEGRRVYIRNGIGSNETNAVEIHLAAGFELVRYHWRMEINLEEKPASVDWPKGIQLRPFDVDKHDHQLYLAHHDAFKDHWGHTLRPYTYWVNNVRGLSDFDPAMWIVAWDGDEIAGYALCREKSEIGWVGTLGVRQPWRKRGLGLALLRHAFGLFFDKGVKIVGLTVDASSPTGATRLYLKAGMRQANEYIMFDKELRPGIEPADSA